MARFCSRCGSLNDEATGLCPQCDREKLAALRAPQRRARFCTACGAPLDAETGVCPSCTRPVAPVEPVAEPSAAEAAPVAEPLGATEVLSDEADTAGETVVLSPEAAPQAEPADVLPPETDFAAPAAEPVTYVKMPDGQKQSRVGKTILSVALSVLLFVVSLLSVAVVCVRYTVSESKIGSLLNDIDYVELFENAYEQTGFSEDTARTFVEALSNHYHNDEITEENMAAFLEDSTVNEFLAEKISDYVEDVMKGTDNFKVTKREIKQLLRDNLSAINDHFDARVTTSDLDELTDYLVDDDFLESIQPSEVFSDMSTGAYYAVNIGISWVTLVVLLLLVVLCLVGMGLNDWSQGAMGAGIVFTAIGGILTLPTLVVLGLPAVLRAAIGETVVVSLLQNILLGNLLIFASVLGFGVLILVVRYLVRRFSKKAQPVSMA